MGEPVELFKTDQPPSGEVPVDEQTVPESKETDESEQDSITELLLKRKSPIDSTDENPAYQKSIEWCDREEEFVKRAGFVLMATMAVHNKPMKDEDFEVFLTAIGRGSSDDRNYVKKAVNWALRQIGKRNIYLNGKAIETARGIQQTGTRSANWIASDAIRELTSDAVQKRLHCVKR